MSKIGQAHGTETHGWIVLVQMQDKTSGESACGLLGGRWPAYDRGRRLGGGNAKTHSLDEVALYEAES